MEFTESKYQPRFGGKAHAFMHKRGFVIPDDVKTISKDVLRHRIGLTYEAEAENVTGKRSFQKF
jgi:MoxR-like ATPase